MADKVNCLPFFSHPATLNFQIPGLLATCPPKVTENKSFIFDVTTGYPPKSERNLAGESSEPSFDKPTHDPQKPPKTNIYIPASRSAAPIVATNGLRLGEGGNFNT